MEFVQPIRNKNQIDNMKKILKSTSLRDFCLFTLGINGGLRISDILRLNITDVFDEKGKVQSRICIREKKTGKEKNYPINEITAKAVREYMAERKPESLNEPLFISQKRNKGLVSLQRDQAYKIINAAARAIGIKEKIGTHTMRKTFGYHAVQSGIKVSIVQKLFNHSSERTTLAYLGLTQDELDDVVINLNL